MKRFLLLLAFGTLATSTLAFGAKNLARDPDNELAGRVRGALHATFGTTAQRIGVTAQSGFIFLYGEVASSTVRTRAAQIAAGVSGVLAVDNELELSPGPMAE